MLHDPMEDRSEQVRTILAMPIDNMQKVEIMRKELGLADAESPAEQVENPFIIAKNLNLQKEAIRP